MALTKTGMGINAARHSDPTSSLHRQHAIAAKKRRKPERVVVDITAKDEQKLGIDTSQWGLKWEACEGQCFLADTVDYVFSSGRKRRVKLRPVSGKEFVAAQSLVNRIGWYHAEMSTKEGKRKVKRKVEKNRLGRICDRHTVTLAPWQTRFLQKLGWDQPRRIRLLQSLQQESAQSFAEKSGRFVVGSSLHLDSQIPHWDHVTSRIGLDHKLCGAKSLPTTVNPEWTLGAHRQAKIGCELSATKSKWLRMNLEKFQKRHPGKTPVLIELHDSLDDDFEQWVTHSGYKAQYDEAKQEYRDWVKRTEPVKEEFAQRRATGTTGTDLAERAAMFALRIVLPPSVYNLVRSTMTAVQVVSDLLEGDRNPNVTGLLLQLTIRKGLQLLVRNKSSRTTSQNFTRNTPKL